MERYLKDLLGSSKFEGVCANRSKTMGSIRGKGNKTTELKLRMAFVRAGLSGFTLHATYLAGKPDFFFEKAKLAVFVDGCFWHGCQRCGHLPKTRSAFWSAKFERNKRRDTQTSRTLRKKGVKVLRFWEHQLKSAHSLDAAVKRVQNRLYKEI